MKDILIFAAILTPWIVLNRWVLPLLGIQTCMSGACAPVPRVHSAVQQGFEGEIKAIGPEEGHTVGRTAQ